MDAAGCLLAVTLPWLVGTAAGLGGHTAVRWWCGLMLGGAWLVAGKSTGVPFSVSVGVLFGGSALGAFLRIFGRNRLWNRREGEAGRPAGPVVGPRGHPGRAAGSIAALFVALLGLTAAVRVLDEPVHHWDAVSIWLPKQNAFLQGEPLGATHMPGYPPLGPAWQAVVQRLCVGSEASGRLLTPTALAAWGFGLLAYVGSWAAGGPASSGRGAAAGSAAAVILLTLAWDADAAASGLQDQLLMAAAGAAVLELLAAWKPESCTASNGALVRGLLLAGLLGMIKNEGAVLGAILLLVFGTAAWLGGQPGGLKRALAAALLLGVWPLLQLLQGIDAAAVQGDGFSLAGVREIPRALPRLGPIFEAFRVHLAGWAALWLTSGMLVAAAVVVEPRFRGRVLMLAAVGVVHAVFLVVVFLATQQDLTWHLETAFDRLMSHQRFVPVTAGVLAAAALGERLRGRDVGATPAVPPAPAAARSNQGAGRQRWKIGR